MGDDLDKICWRGKYAVHFFRKGPAILPHLSVSGACADTYPALRAARRHLRQTYRSFSNPEAGNEMRVVDAIAPEDLARYVLIEMLNSVSTVTLGRIQYENKS